jgi:aldehyde dehydrogenase (NAD+)
MGRGSVIGSALVEHPGIHAISFTGSAGVGRHIAAQCVATHKKVQLELGGKNPQVVLDDADLSQAVELCVQSSFYSTGQRCTASSRLIVTDGIYPRFIEAMKARMAHIRIGDALDPSTDIGPVSSLSQLEQNLAYVEIGKSEGATLATGGERLKRDNDGYYMSPALFSESSSEMRINNEEIFGPVASVIRVKNYEEALATANDTVFGLSAGIHDFFEARDTFQAP